MRKLYLLLSCILLAAVGNAQTPTFLFSDSLGTFNPLVNAVRPAVTVNSNDFNNGIDEYYVNAVPIGFTFIYSGSNYTSLNVNNNGFVALNGAFNATANYFSGLGLSGQTTTNAMRPLIAPFVSDNSCDSIRYQTSGIAPNRVFTVEWTGVKWSYSSTSATLSIQLKLYETTNTIQFIYKHESASPSGSGAQIGLTSGGTGSGSYLSVQSLSAPFSVSSTATASFSSSRPADGQVFTFRVPQNCSGPVQAGTISASVSQVCPGESILLTNTGYTSGVGNINYQWQRSIDNGTTWTNIFQGSNPDSVRVTQAVATRYRFVDTCFTGPTSAISNVVIVTMSTGNPVVYTPIGTGYDQDFESWQDACIAGAEAVPDANWVNQVELGDSSWRRYDRGATANWRNPTFGGYFSSPARSGQFAARLHTSSMNPGTSGSLNAYFNMSAAGSPNYRLGFLYRNSNFSSNNADSLEVWVSTNGGTSFTKLGGALKASTNWSMHEFNFSSTSAQTIIRLKGYAATDGDGDILVDSFYVQRLSNCSGTPSGGAAQSNVSTICPAVKFAVYSQGFTPASGLAGFVYQWQRSVNNGSTWTDISGANTPDSAVVEQTVTTSYRLRATCSFSGLSGNGQAVSVTTDPIVYVQPGTSGYSEDFENWSSVCSNSDQPSPGWYNQHLTGDSSWRRNDQASTANWRSFNFGGLGNPTVSAARSGTYYARFHSFDVEDGRSGYLQLFANLSGHNTYQIGFYYANGNSQTDQDSLQVLLSQDNGQTFTLLRTLVTASNWQLETFNITSNASQAVIRLRGFGDYITQDISVDSFYIIRTSNCSAVTGGTTSTANNTPCVGLPTTIYASGYTSPLGQLGLNFQWEQSTNGTTWTAIAGATTPDSLVVTPMANRSYRLRVTCSFGSATAVSATTLLSVSGVPVYAALGTGVSEDFESWASICATSDRPGTGDNWTTNPATTDSSWRRNDEGATAGWVNPTFGNYTPAAKSGTYSARFHSYSTSSPRRGQMNFYVNASTAQFVRIGFYHLNTGGSDSVTVFASTDGGQTFNRLGVATTSSSWTLRTFDLQAPSATTVIRLQAVGSSFSGDVGVDSFFVRPLSVCSGTPLSGTASTPVNPACSGISYKLFASGFTANTAVGISYQWERSTDNGTTWTSLPGATVPDSVTVSHTVGTQFRLKVRCSTSNDSAVSNVLNQTIGTPAVVYATVGTGLFEDFESWVAGCTSFERPSNNWMVRAVSGNASWRRFDQGVSAGSWSNQFGAYSPASTSGSQSARFHSYNSFDSASMSFYVNAAASPNLEFGFSAINTSGNDSVVVLASTNGGTSFTRLGVLLPAASGWRTPSFTISGATATTILRLRAHGDGGSTDIGIDSFYAKPAVACSGTPSAGTSSGPTGVCAAARLVILNSGFQSNQGVAGISYQWQASTNNGSTWANIAGATVPDSVVTNQAVATQYRLQVTCATGPATASSNAVSVSVTGTPVYASLGAGLSEEFDNWIDVCSTSDRPSASWNNTPATSDSSWRRNDQGSSAGWTSPTFGSYTARQPGNFSARFHASYAQNSRRGNLDFHLNAATPAVQFGFYYINVGTIDNNDSLRVLVSTDGGTSFNRVAGYKVAAAWTLQTITIPNASSTTIIRLQGVADYGSSDIGVDSFFARPDATVPVTLQQFSGLRRNGTNQLSWTTRSEQHVKGFEVERAWGSAAFEQIGFVASKGIGGNSNHNLDYGFADAVANAQVARYRLKMVDLDGRFAYSPVVEIKAEAATQLQITRLYPNPAAQQLNVQISSPSSNKATLLVMDMQGRAVVQQPVQLTGGTAVWTLNVAHLAAGQYRLRLVCNSGCETVSEAFLKQ